jgi:hypothetical protein
VAGEALPALHVGFKDGLIHPGRVLLQPGEQRRAEIETDLCVVIGELYDLVFGIQDARDGVRRVAFGGDALVPVMIRIGGVLQLDSLKPRVFPRRLVKVSVNTNIAFHAV